jgi:hypothetical protein
MNENEQPIIYLNKKDGYLYLYSEAAKQIGRDASVPYYFCDEKDNMIFTPQQSYSSLYHYCSINSMMNIIRNKCLWLTNCQHSNDSQEMQWAVERLGCIIDSLKDSDIAKISTKEQLLAYIKSQIDNLPDFPVINRDTILSFLKQCEKSANSMSSEMINSNSLLTETLSFLSNNLFKDLKQNIFPTYISCFSSAKDNLGQWRGYGDDGRGVAIGFNIGILDGLKNNDVCLRQIAYHENIQRVIMEKGLFEYRINPTNIKNWIYNILPVFKPFAFKEEQEWRLVYVPKEEKDTNLKINCYFKGDQLKQCYELPLANDYVTEIILGPKCNIKKDELVLFFKLCGFNITKEQIIDSNLSYR